MRIQETKLYKFEELSEDAQSKAIEMHSDWNVQFDWTKIYFSGFWSQGDGACFECDFEYRKGGVKAAKDYAPNDQDLHDIIDQWQNHQRRYFYSLYGSSVQSGHYMHENCTSIDVMDARETCHNHASTDADGDMQDILRQFMQWVYRRLEMEYEYLTSEAAIAESLIANELEFTEEGVAA
jgi:hypothetical protein